ncbi:unnamed protein product [Pleuronectes platessa]|uniref:Uncharacterized protein n=1 Tax=Pleuronectes platessa TaxID=8262 RepID=A0A9N7VCV7_PLEPL|nr:unnamed protein product [Pleuronectes platessa]
MTIESKHVKINPKNSVHLDSLTPARERQFRTFTQLKYSCFPPVVLKVPSAGVLRPDFGSGRSTKKEKFNTELQEKRKKNVLQEELENLKASYHEVCQSIATNQEKFNSKLWEEKKKKKNVLF